VVNRQAAIIGLDGPMPIKIIDYDKTLSNFDTEGYTREGETDRVGRALWAIAIASRHRFG
jgi:hypothetical protein